MKVEDALDFSTNLNWTQKSTKKTSMYRVHITLQTRIVALFLFSSKKIISQDIAGPRLKLCNCVHFMYRMVIELRQCIPRLVI